MFTFSNSTKILIIFITTFCSCLAGSTRVMAEDTTWADHGALKVSSNGRYLVHSDGTPFLWMGDTAWGLSERLNRADVDYYLDARKAQGFNVIQLCLFWGKRKGSTNTFYVNPPNDYGHRALKNLTPAGSASANVVAGGDMNNPNDYWDHVDYIVEAARSRGLALAILPVWGARYINLTNLPQNNQLIFTDVNAKSYGEFLGNRYGDKKNIIWVMGGDMKPTGGPADRTSVYRNMAAGIAQGVSGHTVDWNNETDPAWGQVLMTYHTEWKTTTSTWFHDDPWLDFNSFQKPDNDDVSAAVTHDYNLTPVKPVLMSEGAYDRPTTPRVNLRRQASHAILPGGLGHTYGCSYGSFVWTFYGDWKSNLDTGGAQDFMRLKGFLTAPNRKWWKYVPDQGIITSGVNTGTFIKNAVYSTDNDEILVYFANNSSATIKLNRINSSSITESWFNPADGTTIELGHTYNSSQEPLFTPPIGWEDAMLVLKADNDTSDDDYKNIIHLYHLIL